MTNSLEELYLKYSVSLNQKYIDLMLKNKELLDIINKEAHKFYNVAFQDLISVGLTCAENLIKSYDKSKSVPLKAYLTKFIKFKMLDYVHKMNGHNESKGTYQKRKLARKLDSEYGSVEARKKFIELTNIKKESTIDKYFSFDYYDLEKNLIDNEEKENIDILNVITLIDKSNLTENQKYYVKSILGLGLEKKRW